MGFKDFLRKIFGGQPSTGQQPPVGRRPTPAPGRPSSGGAPSRPPSSPPSDQNDRVRFPQPLAGLLARRLSLEASPFAPISKEELERRAKGISLVGNPWFGRTDRIPPITDERTLLIDRGLVSRGYLTPEQLVEIHKVGDRMNEMNPDRSDVSHRGIEAVQQYDSEHQARKKQKIAAAAERRRKHVEDVLRRRQTDIIFLGRGVSAGLADRRANIEKLQKAGLPILATPSDVAQALELSIPRLRWLAFHSESPERVHYIHFTVPKKSGGVRRLAAPHEVLGACQEWILSNILEKVSVNGAAHGFVARHSTLTNAAPHVGRQVVANLDLKDFFPSITFPRVKGIFEELGYSPAAATILGLLCTECPRRAVEYGGKRYYAAVGARALPQGACTSPALSNLATRRFDSRLTGLTRKLGWIYTRYADDLSFSTGPEAVSLTGYLLARVRHIASDEGFSVNEKKTRILRPNAAQVVTGIVVNRRPGVARKTVRRLRAILHRARKEGLSSQNRSNHPHFESWLRGMISYVMMVNPQQGLKLKQAFDALR